MLQDLRFALRMIRSHPWFSAAIVATLALGIGANTTVFTLVNAVLFKPLPFQGGDRIVAIFHNNLANDQNRLSISYPDYLEYRAQSSSFEFLEAAVNEGVTLSEQGNPPEPYALARITPGFLDMLGVQPIQGRGITAEDAKAGANPALLISYTVWRDRYGLAPDAIGRSVNVAAQPATIVGVMPEGFGFPNTQQLWMPLIDVPELQQRSRRALMLVGVRKRGISIRQARADLSSISQSLAAAYPEDNQGIDVTVQTFHDLQNNGPIRLVFYLMQGAVGFVLLIACANVANMMLSRTMGRSREMSIRAAMGASRWHILRQLLVEAILLSVIGGVIGLAISRYGVAAFDAAVANQGKPSWILFTMDYTVFAYFAGLCLVSGLLFGLAPGMQASRVDLNRTLKDGSRGSTGRAGGFLSGALVVVQFSLAVVLLAGAGMFIRGFLEQRASTDGLPANQVLTALVRLPPERYADDDSRFRFYDQLLTGLQSAPEVQQAAIASVPPGGGGPSVAIRLEGEPEAEPGQRPDAIRIAASPGYLPLLDVPILAGRDFDERDGLPGREAVIVTSDFAFRHWPGQNALGRRIFFYPPTPPPANGPQPTGPQPSGQWLTVIGVSGDLDQRPNETDPDPVLFVPYRPGAIPAMTVLLRSASDPAPLTGVLRAEVQKLDPDRALASVMTLAERAANQGWYLRVFGTVFLIFALIALLMASVGIYAVVAQNTGRRTQEIGVRMALGASSGSILGLVIGRGLKQLLTGLAIGLAAALAVTRLMEEVLYRVSPTDPIVFGTVTIVLTSVGLAACWLPARRAAAMHPVNALRHD